MIERKVYHFSDLCQSDQSPEHPVLNILREHCVVANGCFDVLHPGHLSILRTLHKQAVYHDCYGVVAINSDSSVQRLKGPGRPIVSEWARALLISSLQWPFVVLIFDEQTPQLLMDTLRPRAVIKGSEYSIESVIRWSGSEVVSSDMLPGWSTTSILKGKEG